jgi:hypothetical protein
MRANIQRTVLLLANEKDLAHFDGTVYRITRLGELEVEGRRLLHVT